MIGIYLRNTSNKIYIVEKYVRDNKQQTKNRTHTYESEKSRQAHLFSTCNFSKHSKGLLTKGQKIKKNTASLAIGGQKLRLIYPLSSMHE